MSNNEPTAADREARSQIAALIVYAEQSGQTLLAALLSEAADALSEKFFIFKSDRP